MPRKINMGAVRRTWELRKEGKKQEEIAEELGIGSRSVQNYLNPKWIAARGLSGLFDGQSEPTPSPPDWQQSAPISNAASWKRPVKWLVLQEVTRGKFGSPLVWGGIPIIVLFLGLAISIAILIGYPGPLSDPRLEEADLPSPSAITESTTAPVSYELVTGNAKWEAKIYDGVMGIRAVTLEEAQERLIVEAGIVSGDVNRDDGEISLSLAEAAGVPATLDMSQMTIEASIEIPAQFNGYFQIFVNDVLGKSQYGPYVGIDRPGTYQATLSPTFGEIPGEHTDDNFDPTRVATIGISFGSNTDDYQEQFVVSHVRVYPNSSSVNNE